MEMRSPTSRITERDKRNYEQATSSTSPVFTRTGTVPFNNQLCFFCQKLCDKKGRNKLNEVETMETGVKISEAVQKGNSDILKVLLNNTILSQDARAADSKYHLPFTLLCRKCREF